MLQAIHKVLEVLYHAVAPKPRAERVDMTGRKVIVTGVSPQSIGYAIATTLASWGASVVGTNLDQTDEIEERMRGELAQLGSHPRLIKVRPLDLCEPKSVNAFVSWYRKHANDELHVLVNNAGVLMDITMRHTTPLLAPDGEEIHWRTNFLGTFHLTHALLPLLLAGGRASGDARVVFLASDVHERVDNAMLFEPPQGSYKSWDAYGRSKLALIHFSNELQHRYAREHNLQTASMHPGTVDSNLITHGLENTSLLRHLTRLIAPLFSLVFLTREQGAQTPIHCATCVPFEGGGYYERCRVSRASEAANDADVARRVWEYAERWLSSPDIYSQK